MLYCTTTSGEKGLGCRQDILWVTSHRQKIRTFTHDNTFRVNQKCTSKRTTNVFENTLKCLLTLCLLSAIIGKVGGAVKSSEANHFLWEWKVSQDAPINVTPSALNLEAIASNSFTSELQIPVKLNGQKKRTYQDPANS